MPVQYEGVRAEHLAVRSRLRRLRRLAHGRDRDLRARGARAAPAPALQRRRQARGRRRPVLGPLPRRRRRARRPVHLPARRRPLPDGHQRRQPRAATWPGFASTPTASTPRSATASTTTRCSPSRAPRRARSSPGCVDGELPARMRTADARRVARRRRGARLRHRLHGRGRGRDPDRAGGGAGALGRAARRRRDARRARAPATRCGSRSAFTSTATTSTSDRNPIEAGLGWCCKEETGFIGAEAVAAARAAGTAEKLAPFALTERGIPRQGNAVIAGGRGRSAR